MCHDSGGVIAGEVEGVPTREDAERLYCALARIPYPQPDIPFYKALSFFRGAAIAQMRAKACLVSNDYSDVLRGFSVTYCSSILCCCFLFQED